MSTIQILSGHCEPVAVGAIQDGEAVESAITRLYNSTLPANEPPREVGATFHPTSGAASEPLVVTLRYRRQPGEDYVVDRDVIVKIDSA